MPQVKDVPYETICNGHGPMLRYNMEVCSKITGMSGHS